MTRGNTLLENISKLNTFIRMTKSNELLGIYIDKIINGNCVDIMKNIPDNSIDMCITSPPYDNLRTYKGFVFPFDDIVKQLYRITKDGGVVVWIVCDATINGSETCTSFKQAIKFVDAGFNLHDTMIFKKTK